MNHQQIQAFIAQAFPDHGLIIEHTAKHCALIRLPIAPGHLRPGGSVSGPTMMAMADCALYVAILASAPKVEAALTTQLSIHFIARPYQEYDLTAHCQLIKLGSRNAIGEVNIYSETTPNTLVAHAVGTYALPKPPSE